MFPTLSHFFAWVSTQFGRNVWAVQCDNEREFDNSTYRSFFLFHGTQLRMSCPYTSSQNDQAEHMIRIANNVMSSLLFQTSLPAHYWAEGLAAAAQPPPQQGSALPHPYFALFGISPSYDHLRVFRCACYPNLSATAPHKLAPHSTRCVFLGYSPDHKGVPVPRPLHSPSSHLSSRVFDEFDFPFSVSSSVASILEYDALLKADYVTPSLAPSVVPCVTTPPSCCPHDPDVFCAATRVLDLSHACAATRGPDVSHAATCGPGVPRATMRSHAILRRCDLFVALRGTCPRLPMTWSGCCLGSLPPRATSVSLCCPPPGPRARPPNGHAMGRWCPPAYRTTSPLHDHLFGALPRAIVCSCCARRPQLATRYGRV
jgi:hypothetical protein